MTMLEGILIGGALVAAAGGAWYFRQMWKATFRG